MILIIETKQLFNNLKDADSITNIPTGSFSITFVKDELLGVQRYEIESINYNYNLNTLGFDLAIGSSKSSQLSFFD
jgi:hypothetical protein